MAAMQWPKPRFSLKSILVLILGIAIGFSLNLETLRILIGSWNGTRSAAPTYVVEPPDLLQINVSTGSSIPSLLLSGQYLVGPDGNIKLDNYGQIFVAGMTMLEVRDAVRKAVEENVASPKVAVDIIAYNSKVYYIIEKGTGKVDLVHRCPLSQNATISDAIAQAESLQSPGFTKMWLSRPSADGFGAEKIFHLKSRMKIDTELRDLQLLPGDRLFVSTDSAIAAAQ